MRKTAEEKRIEGRRGIRSGWYAGSTAYYTRERERERERKIVSTQKSKHRARA
jgi:hypothetical protein